MNKKSIPAKLARFLKLLYLKLFRINDSPKKIALGFGLGVFMAIMPGVGPVMALLGAFLFRVNRASALLGSILFNTWTAIITFLGAVKLGSLVMGLNYSDVYASWNNLIKNFSWSNLLQQPFQEVLIAVIIGYLIISLCLGILSCLIVYVIASAIKNKKAQKD